MIRRVLLGRVAQKQLRRVPPHVAAKLLAWVDAVEEEGLEEVRKVRGYHDELLKGSRLGQRSIRLSLAYRAVYVIVGSESARIARIEEISKHGY